ncbi:MAG: pirin family protein [Clostridiales Family XIII bacterium]|jgi:redox-sensitive bicupin YhaK (pirin superfamily)|nr:pirin family protein [Clostridiales Family XIII bacterium]
MLNFIDHKKMGRGRHDWLDSHFHFSFAEYCNPQNVQFGALRVLNDDEVQPKEGFGTHPHKDMEIISYVVDGQLTHADSMGNRRSLTRGQVQYMSAGTGVTHSELNMGDGLLRFLQIWIFPDRAGYEPNYGDMRFDWDDRINRWMPIASGSEESPGIFRIHADANVYASLLEKGRTAEIAVNPDRQAYLVLIEGRAQANGIGLEARDALEIIGENVSVSAVQDAHMLLVEMENKQGA